MDDTVRSGAMIVGRYALYGEIAHGGMATIHVGRLMGPAGFARTVAIKRLHPNFAKDPEFVSMFMDEARLAARIHHPNVVSIIDVVALQGELLLVMDYVPGDSFSRLLSAERKEGRKPHPSVVVKIVLDMLFGLHAAHEARNERGNNLGIVHRDISPQNVLVGADGVAHVIDFGVAKAAGRVQTTQDGQIKGKLAYMAPEQIRGQDVDCRTDIYSAAAVLWEALAGRRLFDGREVELMYKVLEDQLQPPSTYAPEVPPRLDHVVMTGLQRDPGRRFATAHQMAEVLEKALAPATTMQVARWVEQAGRAALKRRAELVSEVECSSEVSSVQWAPDVATDVSSAPTLSGVGSGPPSVSRMQDPSAAGDASTQTSSTISKAAVPSKPSAARLLIAAVVGLVAIAGIAFLVVRIARGPVLEPPRLAAASTVSSPAASGTSSSAPTASASADAPQLPVQPVAASAAPDASASPAGPAASQPRDAGKAPARIGPPVTVPDDKTKAQNKYGF